MDMLETGARRGRCKFTYDMSLDDMIAAGQYCEVLMEGVRYPGFASATRCVELPRIHNFGRHIAPYEALKEMISLGVRPATLPELLRFGAEHHDYTPQYHEQIIFALDPERWIGSTAIRYIPALVYWGKDKKWGLSLRSFCWHLTQPTLCSYAVVDR